MKSIVLNIKNCNWGLIGPNMWEERNWIIYSDLSVDFVEIYNSTNDKKIFNFTLDHELYNEIMKNIQLAKENTINVDAMDGEAWEFVEYDNNVEVWKKELGYIYGISPLEKISNILKKEIIN